MEVTFISYLKMVVDYHANHPSLRSGQCYYNVFHALFPEIADRIAGTDIDPFYDNARIEKFCALVMDVCEANKVWVVIEFTYPEDDSPGEFNKVLGVFKDESVAERAVKDGMLCEVVQVVVQ
jgi:hypothetical protein